MSSDEDTFRRLAIELRILEGTAETLQSRINLVRAALTELMVASMTLEGVEKEKKNAPLFVPIGGGSYIKARLESIKEVIVGIGAEVAVERTMKEARENLRNRTTELEKTRNSLGQQLNEVIGKIQEERAELEKVTAKLRERERTRRV
ncbi:MAG: prefoldin subunit alpha [Candidatus Bathyarchaeia archaeon]